MMEQPTSGQYHTTRHLVHLLNLVSCLGGLLQFVQNIDRHGVDNTLT